MVQQLVTPAGTVIPNAVGDPGHKLHSLLNEVFDDDGSGKFLATALTGARAIPVHDNGGQVHNVKAGSGALAGDDSTDDSTDLAAIITTAGPGATLFFPPGTYVLENLSINQAGQRWLAVPGTAVLKLKASAVNKVIATISAANVRIEGLGMTANGVSNAVCVRVTTGGDNARVTRCIMTNPQSGGVHITGSPKNVQVDHNIFTDDGYGVLTADTCTADGITIASNIFTDSVLGDGIEINTPNGPATNVTITNNWVKGYTDSNSNRGIGIGLANVHGGIVSGNTVIGCQNDGMHAENGSNRIVFSSNRVIDCNGHGIGLVSNTVATVFDCKVVNNLVVNCAKITGYAGIFAAGTNAVNGADVTGNTVIGCGGAAIATHGIQVSAGSNNHIAWNRVRNTNGSAAAGLRIANQTNSKITDNRSYDDQGTKTQAYGLLALGSMTDVVIERNDLTGNLTAAYAESSIGTLTRYIVRDNIGYNDGVVTLTASDTTPSVRGGRVFKTNNGSATTITTFDDHYPGQEITVHVDANTTIAFSGTMRLAGSVNFVGTAMDSITFIRDGATWVEKGRSVNG